MELHAEYRDSPTKPYPTILSRDQAISIFFNAVRWIDAAAAWQRHKMQ